MKVSVLLDGDQNGKDVARVYGLVPKGIIKRDEIVVVGDVAGLPVPKPDIEDLFAVSDYLRIYNWAYGKNHAEGSLPANSERIIDRIEELDPVFDHALTAYAMVAHLDEFLASCNLRRSTGSRVSSNS